MELFSGLVELNPEYHVQLNQEPLLERELNPILLFKGAAFTPRRSEEERYGIDQYDQSASPLLRYGIDQVLDRHFFTLLENL